MRGPENESGGELTREVILAAFEKLFSREKSGMRKFAHSGLRHVALPGGAELVERNPKKSSEWAELARAGHRVAWAMRGRIPGAGRRRRGRDARAGLSRLDRGRAAEPAEPAVVRRKGGGVVKAARHTLSSVRCKA